jgi:nucleoside-diphosphate-sugar epimerase
MIRPSVNGNLNVLKAAQKNKVKRVVITSSISAIINQPPATDTHVYDENTWTDI